MGNVTLYSCYDQAGHLFCGDVSYRKSVWRDWVIVNWQRDGQLSNQIYGFVDLRTPPADLARSNRINYDGLNNIKPRICVIVEATTMLSEGIARSEMFDVLTTEVSQFEDGAVSKLKFYLADVEAFMEPCVVVPNVGGTNNSYFWVEPKARWSEMFVQWRHAPHSCDKTEDRTALEQSEQEEEDTDDE